MRSKFLIKPVGTLLLVVGLGACRVEKIDIVNGGACTPYPGFNPDAGGAPEEWRLHTEEYAFCQLSTVLHDTTSNDFPVETLTHIDFDASVPSGQLQGRLCVYGSGGLDNSQCGFAATAGGDGTYRMRPPPELPPSPLGAYVQFYKVPGVSADVHRLIVNWSSFTYPLQGVPAGEPP